MNSSGTLLCFIVISVLSSASAAADIPDWHKPIPCTGCHQETLGASSGPGECGNCHSYILPDNTLNVPLMQSKHNPEICRACHIGNTAIDASDQDIFHNGHNAVQCSRCHMADNSTIIKIGEGKAFQCVSCHGDQVHGIHVKNLDNICSTCHGSWAAGRVYRSDNASFPQNRSQENLSLERFTIFALIKNLISALLGR